MVAIPRPCPHKLLPISQPLWSEMESKSNEIDLKQLILKN